MKMHPLLRRLIREPLEWVMLPVLLLAAIVARAWPKTIDIGLGPEPMINNVYHKQALQARGYSAETFVTSLYFITQSFDRKLVFSNRLQSVLFSIFFGAFLFSIFRYRCLYLYFNGGPLRETYRLWRLEPFLLNIAGVKTVVMAYGSDVQDLKFCPNLLFKHAMARDYPGQRLRRRVIFDRIDLWVSKATHVVGGCDWVDYLHYWDTLMLAHFSIDMEKWEVSRLPRTDGAIRVFHAPNHRNVKGTDFFVRVVEELRMEGVPIELQILQGVPNETVRQAMQDADIVADQLVIGWYAMFAIEAMAMAKPVLCYLREDIVDLYTDAGLIEPDEIPILSCRPRALKDMLRDLVANRQKLTDHGLRGRAFVEKHHSTESVGAVFEQINRSIGLLPRLQNPAGGK